MLSVPASGVAAPAACVLTVLLLSACTLRTQPLPPAPEPNLARVAAHEHVSVTTADWIHGDPSETPTGSLAPLEVVEGDATYYASKFHGRRTASGVVFDNSEMYAAHRYFPFGTLLRVTNLANHRSVIVTVVDRGPFGTSPAARRRILDLSQKAAADLDFMRQGHTPIRIEVLAWGS
jgi:rare lipoprotein A